MDTESTIHGPAVEDALLLSPGRVKQGLLWLGTKEAKQMGLSLEHLIEQAVKNPSSAKYFSLISPARCALGYASLGSSGYYRVQDVKGEAWVKEHGFLAGLEDTGAEPEDLRASYKVLTEEWRQQLQAYANEQSHDGA